MFSKLSLIMLLRMITPVKRQLQLISGLGVTIALWGFSALVAAIFQCKVPRGWATLSIRCFHTVRTAFTIPCRSPSNPRQGRILDLLWSTQHPTRGILHRFTYNDCLESANTIDSQGPRNFVFYCAHSVSSNVMGFESS